MTQWYKIYVRDRRTFEKTLVAQVRSVGLAMLIWQYLENLYSKNPDYEIAPN